MKQGDPLMIGNQTIEKASLFNSSEICYRALELIHSKNFDQAEKLLASNMTKTEDDTAIALFHSIMGVLYKVKGEYKVAWKHYERAEKLLPSDPALKIISARLLIDKFSQYMPAIRKAKKVLQLASNHPVFMHQAYTTIGLAYCKKGDRKKAISALTNSIINSFHDFRTPKNIDFELIEALLRKKWGIQDCQFFLVQANNFAIKCEDISFRTFIERMLTTFESDYADQLENT